MNARPKPELTTDLRINGRRLWDSLMEMAKIGATPKGGVCRLALTDLDRDGRDLFVRWAKEAGCTVRVDRMGNVFARRAGRDDSLAPVVTGSHADSQPTGGKFDGIYGVLGGLEVIRSLNDHGIETERPVEVVIWTNEEGSRFAPAMVASGVFAGVFTLDYGLSRADIHGVTMGQELARIGYAGDVPMGKPIHAAFELHIEQGPILEAEGKTIGVVTHAQGQRWYEVEFIGQESHAGPTPMPRRKDALLAAARMIDLRQPHRSRARALCLRDGRHDPEPSELAQRDSRPRVLHHRHPPSRRCRARGDGPRRCAKAWRASLRRRGSRCSGWSRSSTTRRCHSMPTASPRCALRPSASAIRIAISLPVPATTPAIWRRWRRPR